VIAFVDRSSGGRLLRCQSGLHERKNIVKEIREIHCLIVILFFLDSF